MDALARSCVVRMNASAALNERNTEAVRRFCVTMFDIDPGEKIAESLCDAWQERNVRTHWDTSAGPAMWCKNRLYEWDQIPKAGKQGCGDIRLEAILHVFFLFLDETQEMLSLLPEGVKAVAKPARSKVSKTNELIHPIDKTAERVTHWKT